MHTNDLLEARLQRRDIKPTAIRILVLKAIAAANTVVSLGDLETALDTVDKSTLFRTLSLFVQQRLIHSIDDGSGAVKYALCDEDCDCEIGQLHVHFLCTVCRRAYCLRNKAIPPIALPAGFVPQSISYVIKGQCNKCSKIAT